MEFGVERRRGSAAQTGGESVEGEGASASVERRGATEAARCRHTQLVRVQTAKEADRCG